MLFSALLQRLKATVQTIRLHRASRRKPVVDARLNDVLEMLERDARLKGEMLDELREATRVGEGSLHRSSQVDFAELLRATTESFVPLAGERQSTLTARCAASSVVISADAKDLTRIISRLIACAIAFSGNGGAVDCELLLDPNWVSLIVRVQGATASGRGLADTLRASPWKQFGLSEVRELVELHGGVLRVGSEGDRSGAIFTVRLPGDAEENLLRRKAGPGVDYSRPM
jgi:signal transduction histidine kinase